MDELQALSLLGSSAFEERLKGARYFGQNVAPAVLPQLKAFLAKERVGYVRSALEIAIKRCELERVVEISDAGKDFLAADFRAIQARAIEWVAGVLLHDLEPKIGRLRLVAQKEVADFENSQVKKQIESIRRMFDGISDLRRAAASPRSESFDLSMLLKEIYENECSCGGVEVFMHGPQPFLLRSDPNLLELAISNGVRNSYEALLSFDSEVKNIVIDWGETEVDYWLVILDDGPGLNGGADAAFKVGTTNKKGHSGFGLAIVRQAMENLDGSAKLEPANNGGARLELRWGKQDASASAGR